MAPNEKVVNKPSYFKICTLQFGSLNNIGLWLFVTEKKPMQQSPNLRFKLKTDIISKITERVKIIQSPKIINSKHGPTL